MHHAPAAAGVRHQLVNGWGGLEGLHGGASTTVERNTEIVNIIRSCILPPWRGWRRRRRREVVVQRCNSGVWTAVEDGVRLRIGMASSSSCSASI
jgi:hypothetical protein